ncbi:MULTISPECIES: ABC transporter ATP-binding protein [unclassified Pseudomonas]|uniref:ABC transporter ATP-binding protein n=1 Tax=unclassified Pseudomonas TaxID=196821 RepID=UPI00119BC28A|nr:MULTISPECIES: ABC transporter ATP-binding protein [unclassified Pseudomonas]TWC17542.1 peptide/nickel transport system ATP-binding protein [Pseudomonas sp. SJZ074]TWC19669.1 peptide/nickel transport system ATP-binding protein [Pseudomonas sp. SJZ075]TWC35431.1 peptide/nickel transport system ATP-binding protein [Pseudomonas sp. SJZ078]TWC35548.1 peptide/nickel transport system ATP-binding protein [Pseudomonas sp. SJZ085]TWC56377.1 peptide/nickel transport system ATP-binding protein [Pseudom
MNEIVRVSGLRVAARNEEGIDVPIVHGADFSLKKGEVLALIGESGSGKSTIALSLMGYARSGCRIVGGSVHIGDVDVLKLSNAELAKLRGRTVAYIAQSAAAAFNPSKSIMEQVIESALIHGTLSRQQAQAKAVGLFRALALPDPEGIGARYPHQVSGGQLQRLMAAMALITDPALVILDEPTTALDVTTQIEVLRAFKRVVSELGTTAVYVSHDLAVVAQMADRIVVLRDGQIQENSSTEQILIEPAHPYTRSLLSAMKPSANQDTTDQGTPTTGNDLLLDVRGLEICYGLKKVLQDVDLQVRKGSAVGVIGESGSGKTTLAQAIAGLAEPSAGRILLDGQPLSKTLVGRTREQFRRIQFVFQNADTALNPRHSIEDILGRPLRFYHGMKGAQRQRRVAELLQLVQLPASIAQRRPGELSGGQKQRVNLARALAAEPDLILCDEVTSALDTVVGAAILELLRDLRRELGVSYLFISHDISTVRALCDDIVVMYSGHKVEAGDCESFVQVPFHPYTDLLINSVPELRQGWLESCAASCGNLPPISAVDTTAHLCPFLNRCPVRIDGLCNRSAPPRRSIAGGSEVLCHHESAELLKAQQGSNSMKLIGTYA